MSFVYVEDVAKHAGETITLKGWVYNKRVTKKLAFLQFRDGTGIIQCVAFGPDQPELYQQIDALNQESSIEVTGEVKEDKRSVIGFEIGLTGLKVVADVREEYPITPKEHGTAFLLDHRHLWLRSKKPFAVMRIRDTIIRAIHDFFGERGFVHLDAPIFTPNACEGTSTLFGTKYFDTEAYLSQSGQLYMEAGAAAFGKVYDFGPTFRAEKSKTRRHLTEFWMIEPEVAYMDLEGDMELAEDMLSFIVQRVLEKRRPELEILERDVSKLEAIQAPFPRLHYDDAIRKLQELGREIQMDDDFGAEDEAILSNLYDRPLIVHHYPTAVKAFYMKKDAENPARCLSMDILAPEGVGEIVGGSQREDDYDVLLESIRKHGLDEKDFDWYLDLRKYGSFPHSGFGLGLERTIGWICGEHHIRACVPFPRTMERLAP